MSLDLMLCVPTPCSCLILQSVEVSKHCKMARTIASRVECVVEVTHQVREKVLKARGMLEQMNGKMEAAMRAPDGAQKAAALQALSGALCYAQAHLTEYSSDSIQPSLIEACRHADMVVKCANAMHFPLCPM